MSYCLKAPAVLKTFSLAACQLICSSYFEILLCYRDLGSKRKAIARGRVVTAGSPVSSLSKESLLNIFIEMFSGLKDYD